MPIRPDGADPRPIASRCSMKKTPRSRSSSKAASSGGSRSRTSSHNRSSEASEGPNPIGERGGRDGDRRHKRSVEGGPRPYRLTVDQYLKMINIGIFQDSSDVVLIGGRLVGGMTKNDPHDFGVGMLADRLRLLLPDGLHVREEKSMNLDRWSRPGPDLVIARGLGRTFGAAPGPKDVTLVVEVADTSYAKDRGANWRRHAAARVPLYWIVNIPMRRIEAFSEPSGEGKAAAYRGEAIHDETAEIPLVLDGRELGRIAVKDVLP